MAKQASSGADLEAAHAHVRAGRMAEAEVILRKIVTSDPDDAGALHLLGGIALGRGRIAAAEDLVRKAIRSSPRNPGYHDNLGAVLLRQDKADEAIAAFRTAIELDPGAAMTHNNLGNALRAQNRLPEAVACYRRALEIDAEYASAWSNLGAALGALDRLDEAASALRRALLLQPGFAEALANLGNVLHIQGKLAESEESFIRALEIDPGYAMAYSNLGILLKDLGRYDEAEACLRRAIEAEPNFAMAHNNLGNALEEKGDFEGAAACLRRALELDPNLAVVHGNLGTVYRSLGRLDDALACLRRALEIDPGYATAYSNLGALLKDMGRYGEAEESFIRALEIDPGYALAKNNFALSLLVQGDFARAWPYYAARPSMWRSERQLWQRPLPEDLNGKRILLLKDQGLGDEIFFLRFAPQLKERGAVITYLAHAKIAPVIARLAFIDKFAKGGETPEEVDFTLSVADLPLALGMKSAADIPPAYPLPVAPERAAKMEARLKRLGPAPYVGVTWRAGVKNKPGGVFKLAPLGEIAKVLAAMEGTVLVLQRNPEAGEIDALSRGLGREAHDLTALNDELEDMLALLALLDDYVTVSNTNVHLRAGAGGTCRVLVPDPPEWRWMAAGDESPWFPGSKVYRQGMDGDWGAAFQALTKDLYRAYGGEG